jgi:MarR family transcriptional regulator, organic hydroperoxide resistance regulator
MHKKSPVKKVDPFPFDTSPSHWVYRVRMKADAMLRKIFQDAGYVDMTPEQWSVMARLYEIEGMNQCQLGEKTLKDRHNITRILNRLEKKSLIERRRCAGDNRSFRIYLTETGRRVERELSALALGQRRYRYKGMSAQDLEVLRELLQKLFRNIEDYLAQAPDNNAE